MLDALLQTLNIDTVLLVPLVDAVQRLTNSQASASQQGIKISRYDNLNKQLRNALYVDVDGYTLTCVEPLTCLDLLQETPGGRPGWSCTSVAETDNTVLYLYT